MARRRQTGAGPGVQIHGLREMRSALRRIDRDLDKQVAQALRGIGRDVRAAGRQQAAGFQRTGALKRSIRMSVTTKRASVYSNLPQAPVLEFGGTISPRGTPITIGARSFLRSAVTRERPGIERTLEGVLEDLANTWGAR